jgi:tRNA 5-methylaminomethyl-2-thiouridine biosynthesis bifunctional protein
MAGIHCVGASFNLRETTPEPRAEDDQHNLAQLQQHAPQLYAAMGGDRLTLAGSRVGFRCQSPDFLPLAGQLSTRVYCSIAHGSRGITGTPLCADIIAASICGDLPLADRQLRDALSPGRFRARHERRRRARQASQPSDGE